MDGLSFYLYLDLLLLKHLYVVNSVGIIDRVIVI